MDYNERAAKGQALNLAMSVAIAEGKQNDLRFILQQVARFLELSNTIQKTSAHELHKILDGTLDD